MKSIFRNFPAR